MSCELKDEQENLCLIDCKVGGVRVRFMIDSGCPVNTITEEAWRRIQQKKARVFNVRDKCVREFRPYATCTPLEVVSVFSARVEVNELKPSSTAEFFVVRGATQSLLGFHTSRGLKVLKVGITVQAIREQNKPFAKFPGVVVDLEVDKTVTPRQLAYYRVPAAVENLVEDKLQSLIDEDIIEMVDDGTSEWISPLLVVPKGQTDIRICVDMRGPNKAIKRERYPMPMIETFLPKLRGAAIFSRLDIKNAFHLVELSERSRNLTTFMTARGLMRYKRLMFGLNAAPEKFQKIMENILQGLEGVIAFIDDIVVFGRILEEHDDRLAKVLGRLKTNNTMLNKEKCRYHANEIEILGFLVDGKGIRPAPSKVAALRDFREPASKEEERRFLGLVQFIGHFIPNLATRTEPLRMMIREEVKIFGPQQKEAFDDLRLELAETVRKLGYFDPKDETQVFVDASPVGLVIIGQPFSSIAFGNYCETNGVKLIKTIPYWPQMNGEVERQNRGAIRVCLFLQHKTTLSYWKSST